MPIKNLNPPTFLFLYANLPPTWDMSSFLGNLHFSQEKEPQNCTKYLDIEVSPRIKYTRDMNTITIGLVQMRCEKGAVAENLATIQQHIQEGISRGVDILCFPEMSITGYLDPHRWPESVLRLDSPEVARFVAMTAGAPITALAGLVEANPDGKPFITQIVARSGELLGYYRKKTIIDEEAAWFSPGAVVPVFAHPKGTFGVAICADIEDPAIFAESARQGAGARATPVKNRGTANGSESAATVVPASQFPQAPAAEGARIIFEAAAPGLYGDQATRNWQSGYTWWRDKCQQQLGQYARDNGVYIAVATQAGRTIDEDFPGGGYLFAPDGSCISATPDWSEGVLYASVRLE
jgi:predicted amidohydrolase